MLNWGDLRKLAQYSLNFTANPNGQNPQICVMVSVPGNPGQLFAVTINNEKTFRKFAQAFFDDAGIKKLNKSLEGKFSDSLDPNQQPVDSNTDKLAQLFLTDLNNVNNISGRPGFDVSLYQIENDNTSLNTPRWNKIILDSTAPNGVRKVPCN